MMARVFVSIGSNVDPGPHIEQGLAMLEAAYGPLTVSPVYESRAVGFTGRNFLNLVAAFDTDETPEEVHRRLREMEARAGRRRGGPKFADRTLDLDLLLHGDHVRRGEGLNIPRGGILEYAFVLRPLADIAPGMRHPETGRTFGELWAAFDDPEQPLWPVSGGDP